MIYDIFHILLWVTVIMLVISGIDDLLIDIMYWFFRKKYKKGLPSFSEINSKPERSIAIMIGAWREEKVIGRTVTIALKKLRYANFRIFVAVYPNDLKTVKVVREIARKDSRVILCLNPQDGPTTKADNLNNSFTCIKEYERQFGEFDVILIHDSEDFIHPLSLKLYNYLIMYKGNYAVQIPVIPIKNKLGRLFHRTYCDTFAELHTKDMIVRQSVGSFIPFAGTGMAFNRKAFHYLESESIEAENRKIKYEKKYGKAPEEFVAGEDYIQIMDEEKKADHYGDKFTVDPYPEYEDIPIPGWDDAEKKKTDAKPKSQVRQYSVLLIAMLLMAGIFVLYATKASSESTSEGSEVSAVTGKELSNSKDNKNTSNNSKTTLIDKVDRIPDNEMGVLYEASGSDVRLQESAWESKDKASRRMNVIKRFVTEKGKGIEIVTESVNGKTLYKVFISGFTSLKDAKGFTVQLRDYIK